MVTRADLLPTTLPARYYTDAELFQDELERFFCQTWVCAGRIGQITSPGDFFVREIGNESIIMTCDEGGHVNAFYNVCRHRGTRICAKHVGKLAGRILYPYNHVDYVLM